MSALPKLQLLDTVHGDVVLDQQQAADIGNAMGNGAASFTSLASRQPLTATLASSNIGVGTITGSDIACRWQ